MLKNLKKFTFFAEFYFLHKTLNLPNFEFAFYYFSGVIIFHTLQKLISVKLTLIPLAVKQKITYTLIMNTEKRRYPRYQEIGRAFAPDLCALPAVLDDISAFGCKIHYSFPIVVNLEAEYELKISPLHNENQNPLNLICTPQWVKEIDGSTFIGFKTLYSPDAKKLNSFISLLENISEDQI